MGGGGGGGREDRLNGNTCTYAATYTGWLQGIPGQTLHTYITYRNKIVHGCTDSGHRLRDVRDDPTFLCLLMQDHELGHLWEASD